MANKINVKLIWNCQEKCSRKTPKMSGSGKEFEAEWSVAERGFKFAAVNYATFFLYNRRYTAGGNPKGFFVYILVLL